MSFFTFKKRCSFCAHELDKQNKCQNPECIAYTVKESENTNTDSNEDVEV